MSAAASREERAASRASPRHAGTVIRGKRAVKHQNDPLTRVTWRLLCAVSADGLSIPLPPLHSRPAAATDAGARL